MAELKKYLDFIMETSETDVKETPTETKLSIDDLLNKMKEKIIQKKKKKEDKSSKPSEKTSSEKTELTFGYVYNYQKSSLEVIQYLLVKYVENSDNKKIYALNVDGNNTNLNPIDTEKVKQQVSDFNKAMNIRAEKSTDTIKLNNLKKMFQVYDNNWKSYDKVYMNKENETKNVKKYIDQKIAELQKK